MLAVAIISEALGTVPKSIEKCLELEIRNSIENNR